MKDTICDIDCAPGEDIDCPQQGSGGIIIAIGFIITIFLILAYKKKWLRLQR